VALAPTLRGLIRACHPEPTLAVTLGAATLAVAMHRDARGVVAVAAVVLASQLAAGWHNDWLDAERDAAAGRPDKPIPAGLVARRTVGIAAIVATAVTVPLAVPSGATATVVAAIGLAGGLAYNWPLKSTPFSVVPYAISFAALPVFVLVGRPGTGAAPGWLLAAGATLGAGAHFANVVPDLDDDQRTGISGLPHLLGPLASAITGAILLITASALIAWGPPGAPTSLALVGFITAVVVLLIGGYAGLRRPGSRLAFRAVLVAALIDVAMLLAAGPRL
jgi:4-hydroxybenzoate polyprenyltransferase